MNPKLKDLPLLFFFLSLSALTFAQEDSLRCEIRSLQHEITALKLEADAAGGRSAEDFAPGTPSEHRDYQTVQGEIFEKQALLDSCIGELDAIAQKMLEEFVLKLNTLEDQRRSYNNAFVLEHQDESYELLFQQNQSVYRSIYMPSVDELILKSNKIGERQLGRVQLGCKEIDVKSLKEWIELMRYFTPYYRLIMIKAEVYGEYLLLFAGFDSIGETYNDYFEQTFYLKKVQP